MYDHIHRPGLRDADPVRTADADAASDRACANRASAALIERQFAPTSGETIARGEQGVAGPGSEVPHRASLEQAIGADFGGVRAHTGPEAQAACVELGAEAFALGNDVAFLDENPAPEVVAHELAHTMQQGGEATVQPLAESSPATDAEGEADAVADHVRSGAPGPARVHVRGGGERAVRRLAGLVHKFDAWATKRGFSANSEAHTVTHERSSDHLVAGESDQLATQTNSTAFDWSKLSLQVKDEFSVKSADPALLRGEIEDGRDIVARDQKQLQRERAAVDRELSAMGLDDERDPSVGAARDKLEKRAKLIDDEIAANKKTLQTIDGQLAKLDQGNVGEVLKEAKETARDYSQRSLLKQATIWSIDTKSIGRSTTRTETEHHGNGTSSSKERQDSVSGEVGEGVKAKKSKSETHRRTDAAGNSMGEHSREREVSGGVVMKEDGSVGLGGGGKLKESLTSQHGTNVFVEASGTGAYTVNIIPIPDRDPPAFAAVTTLSLGGELGGGVGKESSGKRGKGSGKLTAGASASVEVTHTHVLDQAQVRGYLADLEKAGEGKPTAGKLPEFALLQRAHAGIMDADDAAIAVQSLFGDSAAAAGMSGEESIEMTTKVGARAGVSVGAEGKGGGKGGVEAGGSKEVYRTVKISRLPDAGDAKLMEVTIAFGGADTMHGALTASGLGVSAKVGAKQWSSADELVTFRLDANEPDYEELYGEVVGCLTPNGLISLRENPRYLAHVARYTRKKAHGGSTSFEVGPSSGIGSFGSERAHSRTNEITKEDGAYTVTDTGGSTDTTRVTLGPVDVLRHDRAESVKSVNEGGRQFIEIGEDSTDTSVQWKIPGLKELITAESPAKAVKKAMEAKRTRLVEYHLDDAALDVLVARARDSSGWTDVGNRHYNPVIGRRGDLDRWHALRNQLITPAVSAELAAWDPAAARSVARGAALCDFMDQSYNGFGFLQAATREWNDGLSLDIGVMYEWPMTLKPYEPIIDKVRRRVALIDIELDAFESDEENGAALGADVVTNIQKTLSDFQGVVEGCTSFHNPRAKLEILNDIDEMRNRLVQQRREFFLSFGDGTRDAEVEDENDHAVQIRRRNQLEDLCGNARKEEIRLMVKARIAAKDGGMFGPRVMDELPPVLHELRELHYYWIERIKELRHVYLATDTESSGWMVSKRPGDERTMLEPHADDMRELYDVIDAKTPFGMSTWGSTGSIKMNSSNDNMELYDY